MVDRVTLVSKIDSVIRSWMMELCSMIISNILKSSITMLLEMDNMATSQVNSLSFRESELGNVIKLRCDLSADENGRPSSVAPSVARSFSLGPRGQRGSSVHAEESNYGREAAASFAVMPWNASYSSAAGELASSPNTSPWS